MILVFLYVVGGAYLLAMSFGLLHKRFVSQMNNSRRLALGILGGGFLLLGANFAYYYTVKLKETMEAPEIYHRMERERMEGAQPPRGEGSSLPSDLKGEELPDSRSP